MPRTRLVAALAALAVVAALAPVHAPQASALEPRTVRGLLALRAGEPAADTLLMYGEYAGGGARVETVDLDTGMRRTLSDTRGDDHARPADHEAGHGTGGSGGGPGAASNPRCTNDGEHAFLNGPDRYWRWSEAWVWNPANAPASVPNWRSEVLAASDVWRDAANPCGLPDTVAWPTPAFSDDAAANVPKQHCLGNPSDGKNAFGFRAFDNDDFVAYACLFASGQWILEGDVAFNTLVPWCHGCPAGPGGYDVRAAAVHEWGHILGLGHPCEWGSPTDPCAWDSPASQAVMFPSISNAHTTLSKADVQGAEALYPREHGFALSGVTVENPAGAGTKLAPGHTYTVHVDLRNDGMLPWRVGDPAFAVATLDGAASGFTGPDWLSPSRPSTVDADRTNGPGHAAGTIVRDEVARFTFQVPMALAREGTTPSLESLGLLHDDGTPSFLAGPAVTTTFDVGTYGTDFHGQAGVPVVVQGVETTDVWVDLENTGTAPWFVNETLTVSASDGAGAPRCSALAGSNWSGCGLASRVDENVTRTVLPTAPSTAPVLPGQVGRFRFRFASPIDPGLVGVHVERFEARLDGGRFAGSPTSFTLAVL